jgi:BON domain
MSEAFFGLGQPMWTGLPAPGFSWFQPASPAINRAGAMPFAMNPIPSVPLVQNMIPFAVPASYQGLNGPDVMPSPNALALLSATALRRGQPMGPTNDQEIEEFIYETLDLLPGANDVELRSEGGRITFTGSVHHKRLKRDIGEIGWAIPGVNDVQNNLVITTRRRARSAGREPEPPNQPARKQA